MNNKKTKDMMRNVFVMIIACSMAACSSNNEDYDATGTFEATEVTVSAEQNGRLMAFDVTEGAKINANEQVGLIDTVQLQLKARQIGATRESFANQRPDLQAQIAATQQEIAKAEQEQRRFAALVKDNAAKQKAAR
jgi:HlyD family secretion protein